MGRFKVDRTRPAAGRAFSCRHAKKHLEHSSTFRRATTLRVRHSLNGIARTLPSNPRHPPEPRSRSLPVRVSPRSRQDHCAARGTCCGCGNRETSARSPTPGGCKSTEGRERQNFQGSRGPRVPHGAGIAHDLPNPVSLKSKEFCQRGFRNSKPSLSMHSVLRIKPTSPNGLLSPSFFDRSQPAHSPAGTA